ncbi:hypothetical protein [Streptomyces caelestis]|uniref:hypothetical protein n=1 Tax=Streptomyces caelestis TaxID=36816 RepID=UPI003649AD79
MPPGAQHGLVGAQQHRQADAFSANGTVPVARALAGLAVGALTGLLLRRAAAALGALWAAVHAALPHLWPVVTETNRLEDGPTGPGITVAQGLLTADGDRLAAPRHSSVLEGCGSTPADLDAVGFYRDFHPAGHYWPLQLVASGLLLLVAVLVTLTAFRLLRRRTGKAAG